MILKFHGKNGTKALFVGDGSGVVVDEIRKEVVELGDPKALIASASWDTSSAHPGSAVAEIATATITSLDVEVLSEGKRMYTIPKGVSSEAKRGLEWRKEHKRGGTNVGMNTARTLAKGGQIGIEKVRHIAKYFPRHEVDKKGKGYKPGQDGYPSAGRIAWALWGGDAAKSWASAIVERENKKKKSEASSFTDYYDAPEKVQISGLSEENAKEFFVRLRLDGSGIDRLYRVDREGACQVWDDGQWDDMGNISHDFTTYDRALDDPYDQTKKIHVPIDVKSAAAIAAFLDSSPFDNVDVSRVNYQEYEGVSRAIPELDWDFIDQLSGDELEDTDYFDDDGLTAAGEPGVTNQDGNYTPEERSDKAKQQVRDKMGKFAKTGSTVVIGGNPEYTGKILSVNPDTQEVNVQLQNDEVVSVPANITEQAETFKPVSQTNFPQSNLDFSGILGEPRVPIDQPLAQLPGRLPPLTTPDVNTMINDWSAWVADQRLSPEYAPGPAPKFIPKALPDPNSVLGEYYKGAFKPDGTPKDTWNPATAPNVYNEPLLRDWLDAKYRNKSGQEGYHNRGWYVPKPEGVPIEEKRSRSEVMSPENRNRLEDRYNPVNFSITAAGEEGESKEEALTPETSDVPPMYMAIVDKDDPQAVLNLVSLVPATNKTGQAATFKRKPGEWERDDSILTDLKSPTPPPVVVLSNEDLAAVLKQIDGEVITGSVGYVHPAAILSNNNSLRALVAKGGLDRNRGNAERLRRYWTVGPGALKIRWNTPGDWTRCYRQLAKYMGPRAKGYCSLRHKEMTGTWPGSKYNVGKKNKTSVIDSLIASVRPEEDIINDFTLRARAESARVKVMGGRSGPKPMNHGAKFIIPLVIPEELESGDGRIFKKDSISFRDLPLPLLWQIKTGQGHDGSVVVGQILHMEKTPGGIGNAYGVFDSGKMGQEAERLVRHGFIRGVSADMDQFEADEEDIEIPDEAGDDSEDTKKISAGRISITKARVMAVTIVPKPAFQECFIQIIDEGAQPQEDDVVPDGTYVEGVDDLDAAALVACGMVAGAIPLEPPKDWFKNPSLEGPTPLTITDDGRVFGHIAAWHVDHIGMSFGTKPPRNRSNYAYFHTGTIKTQEGVFVPVGQLTLAGGHAGLEASADEAVRHYDDTASAFADVHAGEDAFGIWVAGSLRPGITPEQIRAARASAPSGDWRPIKGRLELVAVCQVNVPGFPIARARVASGQVMALVAAGAKTLAQMKSDPIAELSKKIQDLENAQKEPLVAAAESAKKRVEMAVLEAKKAELAARVKGSKPNTEMNPDYMNQMFDDDPENEMAVISRRIRERLAKEGKALDDGSYPIRNVSDLKNAIRAYGRSKPGKRAKVRRHIIKRARALKKTDLIPEKWASASTGEFSSDLRTRAEAAAKALTAAAGDADPALEGLTEEEIQALKEEAKKQKSDGDASRPKYTAETQPRDASGKFRRVLARLKTDLGSAGLARVVEKVEETENLDFAGDYNRAADSAKDLINIIDRLDTKALNPEALENVRESSKELGDVISNLPFAFGEQAQKIRFSDVPPALKKLMEDMIDRVEQKIDQEDADEATAELKSFMSGGDYYSQSEISSQMAKLLRLLT